MANDKRSASPKGRKSGGEKKGSADANPIPDVFAPMRKVVEGVRPKSMAVRWIALAAFAVVLALVFRALLDTPASALEKFAGSALLFVVGGELMRAWMGWDGFLGLILFKDRSTLAWIDRQAQRYANVWNVLADLGLVMGYGLCSYFLLGPQQRKPARLAVLYLLGLPLLLLFSTIIAPTALTVMTGLVSHNDFHAASSYLRDTTGNEPGGLNYITLFISIALLVGGLAATTFLSLVIYAALILPPVLVKIGAVAISILTGKVEGSAPLPPPGGAPILPGVNLPFVEGILALAVLLVVHEMSHGLLARVAKIRLDSAGIVFLGILPFGAFVEPDEKELDAVPAWQSNRVLVAGSTANLLTAIVAFLLLVAFMQLTTGARVEGWRVVSGGTLPAGTIIEAINGTPYFGQNVSLSPNQSVVLQTDRGEMVRTTDAKGRIGIQMEYVSREAGGFRFQYAPGSEWMGFIANVLGLIFALDVLVGVVNLLPIPLFDGHRLMVNGVGKKWLSDAITVLASGAFVVNFLPWLFR